MNIQELEDKHKLNVKLAQEYYYLAKENTNLLTSNHTKLSIEFAIEQLNNLKLYDGGEMQSMSESIYNSIFDSQIEDKIQKLKQYLNE